MIESHRNPLAVGYIRASTDRQSLSPDMQKPPVLQCYESKFTETHDWWGFLVDGGESASKKDLLSRKAGRQLATLLHEGDVLIVHKTDRVFRNLADQANCMKRWEKQGVTLVSAAEGWDTSMAGGQFLANIMGAVAQEESRRLGIRVREAYQASVDRGQPMQRAPIGFKWEKVKKTQPMSSKNRVLVPDIPTRMAMGGIVEGRRRGESWPRLALNSGRWGNQTSAWYAYRREILYRWLEINGVIEPRKPEHLRMVFFITDPQHPINTKFLEIERQVGDFVPFYLTDSESAASCAGQSAAPTA